MKTHYKTTLGLGSNIADRYENILEAETLIQDKFEIIDRSSLYESISLLKDNQQNYYNKVITINSDVEAEILLEYLQDIEVKLGRKIDHQHWLSRVIDIDIIDFAGKIVETDRLTIPHIEMHNRSFVLYPLLEIDTEYIHPKSLKSIKELISDLQEDYQIRKIDSVI